MESEIGKQMQTFKEQEKESNMAILQEKQAQEDKRVAAYNQKIRELEEIIEKQIIANLDMQKQALSKINYQKQELESMTVAHNKSCYEKESVCL